MRAGALFGPKQNVGPRGWVTHGPAAAAVHAGAAGMPVELHASTQRVHEHAQPHCSAAANTVRSLRSASPPLNQRGINGQCDCVGRFQRGVIVCW